MTRAARAPREGAENARETREGSQALLQLNHPEVVLAMVAPAQQDQVGEVGSTAFDPRDQMVRIAPRRLALAAGNTAAAIASREGFELRGGGCA